MFLRVRACHPLREAFPGFFHFKHFSDVAVLLPHVRLDGHGLGSSAFARHYLRNHFCFLLLRVLRCFSSPRSPPDSLDMQPSVAWVAPFGNPRIKDYLHLPGAYRSLSRPSSPPRAKASALRPSLFFVSHDQILYGIRSRELYFFTCSLFSLNLSKILLPGKTRTR